MFPSSRINKIVIALNGGLCALAMVSTGQTAAADWAVEADAVLSSEFNDNQRLTPEVQDAVWGHHLALDMQLAGTSTTNAVSVHPQYQVNRFSSAGDLDNEVAQLDVATRHHTESTVAELSLEWRHDTTLTSELEDTGLVQTSKQRTVHGVHPSYRHVLTERVNGQLRWDYTDVVYKDALLTALTDYRYYALTSTIEFKKSGLDSARADLYGSQLQTTNIGNRVTDIGVKASISHAFYEQSYGTFTIGIHRVENRQELPGIDYYSAQRGFLGDVMLSQDRNTLSWNANLRRTVDPSGAGMLVQNDKFGFDVIHKLGAHWTGNISGVYIRNEAFQTNVSFDSRRYARIAARAFWSPAKRWQASLRYAYQWQQYESAQRGADSNELGLGITYQLANTTLRARVQDSAFN